LADNKRLKAKKSLGQNYLVADAVAGRIVEAISPKAGELIFEIGPGKGALTSHLSASGADIVAFEIDKVLAEELKQVFRDNENVEIVREDILKVDFGTEAEKRGKKSYKIIGNIPYMLTSTIILRIPAETGSTIAVIMVQKEVADRIVTPVGETNCGLLTVFLQSYLKVERVLKVAAGSFRPRPGVDSAVLRLTPVREKGAPVDRELYFAFLKKAFSMRRKKLRNVLFRSDAAAKRAGVKRLETLSGVDMGKRAENLKLEDWFNLFSSYVEMG
jgi:16S rRNA (adenine1518-N6/adenine1519-N6)-dimethyltransferase